MDRLLVLLEFVTHASAPPLLRRYPDFTIEDADTGITWYLEHLGMLGDVEYDTKWKAKLKWYEQNGILPDEAGGGPNGTLLTTTELDGIDHPQIADRIKKIKSGG